MEKKYPKKGLTTADETLSLEGKVFSSGVPRWTLEIQKEN